MSIVTTLWGTMPDGTAVHRFTLENEKGMRASVISYGAALVELFVPEADGGVDVVLGFDSLEEYLADTCYFGCVIGRVANRIAGAQFSLGDKKYCLDINHGSHHLHGGAHGFHACVWEAEPVESPEGPAVRLRRVSPDGEQGYPGTVHVSVTYVLTENGLRVDFHGSTDAPTIMNLTNHAYFNLSGNPQAGIGDHEVQIDSGLVLEVDGDRIPTGKILDTAGTVWDFLCPVRIDERQSGELKDNNGESSHDHYYVGNARSNGRAGVIRRAATLFHRETGRIMEVRTTQPGVHFYTGEFIPKGLRGKDGTAYGPGAGLCFESQGYPDAPNREEFPSVALMPGETYEQSTEFRFFFGEKRDKHTGE